MIVNKHSQAFYLMALDYIAKQRYDIRCLAVGLDKANRLYAFSFASSANMIAQTFDQKSLEFAIHPEPIVKYLVNKANYALNRAGEVA